MQINDYYQTRIVTLNRVIVYKLLGLNRNTYYHATVSKLMIRDKWIKIQLTQIIRHESDTWYLVRKEPHRTDEIYFQFDNQEIITENKE